MKRICACLFALLLIVLISQPAFALAPEHVWSEWTITKQPTCTEAGSKTRVCTADTQNSHSENEVIPALGHEYTIETKEPTCTEAGKKIYTCSRCGVVKSESFGTALGHEYTVQITKEATCTESGIKTYTCVRCQNNYTEETLAIGHEYEKTAVTQPDCQHEGIETFVCKHCGDTYSEIFEPKAKHQFEKNEYRTGYYIHTEKICSVCGYEEESTVRINIIAVANTVMAGLDFVIVVFFLIFLIPDFYVLLWYRRRKKEVMKQSENDELR